MEPSAKGKNSVGQVKPRPTAGVVLARIAAGAVGLLLLLGLLLLGVYVLVRRAPTAYRPATLSEEQQLEALNELTKKVEVLYNQTNAMAPFIYVVEEDLINRLLLLEEVQRFVRMLGPEAQQFVGNPQVAIGQQTVRLMATARYESIESVWTITLKGHIDGQGKLQLSLGSMKAGALGLPEAVVHAQLERLVVALQTLPQRRDVKVEGLQNPERYPQLYETVADHLEELLRTGQVTVEPVFPVDKDKNARVLALMIRQGQIELALQPVFAP